MLARKRGIARLRGNERLGCVVVGWRNGDQMRWEVDERQKISGACRVRLTGRASEGERRLDTRMRV